MQHPSKFVCDQIVLYSPRYKFLFVHIPKTGGTSVRAALKPLLYRDPWYWLMWFPQRLSHLTGHRTVTKFPRHARIIAAKEMLPWEIFSSLHKFSVVRNPWDMQVSSYFHLQREHPEVLSGLKDFEAFVFHKLDAERDPCPLLDISGTPQVEYLRDMDGRLLVDEVIRFETLETDTMRVFARLGRGKTPLPHKRKGERQRDYRSYYSDRVAAHVASWYKADLEAFDYRFDDPGTEG